MIPWAVARQAPLSMEFSGQEYWSGLPFPSPGDLPNPEIEPESLVSPALAVDLFSLAPLMKPYFIKKKKKKYLLRTKRGARASQMVLVVKNPPVNAGDIRDVGSSLGQEDPLEEGMATHSSILAWGILWIEEPGEL